jgi:type II secretory pathway component PulF
LSAALLAALTGFLSLLTRLLIWILALLTALLATLVLLAGLVLVCHRVSFRYHQRTV